MTRSKAGSEDSRLYPYSGAPPHNGLSPRTLLFFFAVVVQLIASAISGIGFISDNPAFMLAGTFTWVLWFIIIFMVAAPKTDFLLEKRQTFLKRGAMAIFIALLLFGSGEFVAMAFFGPAVADIDTRSGNLRILKQNLVALEHTFHYNDATALCQQAVNNLIDMKNPYTHANVVTALEETGGSYERVTPLRRGLFARQVAYPNDEQLLALWDHAILDSKQAPVELESKFTYPAGSFLLPAPFMLAGIKDIRIVYAIVLVLTLIYVARLTRGPGRVLFIGASVVSLEVWSSIAGGETGILAFAFLLPGWALARRFPWQSAVFMGLAVATKQTAWLFLPVYLILVFRTGGLRRLVPVASIIAGALLATNLPFIIMDPRLWFESVMAPMFDRMYPLGVGIIAFVTTGLIGIHSQVVFAVLESIAEIFCIGWYWKYGGRYPDAGPIMAVLPLFFAWRSLWTYFFYIGLIILASILINEKSRKDAFRSEQRATLLPE